MTEQPQNRLDLSVIIPTYNRRDSLLRTLESLSRQTYPADRFEVIVVDDGGNDGTAEVADRRHPFPFRYIRQENQGDAAARNRGAQEARGDVLQFLDDDIVLEPGFISAIALKHAQSSGICVIGRLLTMASPSQTVFERVTVEAQERENSESGEISFTEVLAGVLSVRREDYVSLGMMQPVTKTGSSVWCDVEFAYRARQRGLTFWKCADAIAHHDDYVMRDLHRSCQRARRAALTAVDLVKKHPELEAQIPSLRDKGPIDWRKDQLSLILRKTIREVASSGPIMWSMQQVIAILERLAPASRLLSLFYRWFISGHIHRGYREGIAAAGRA